MKTTLSLILITISLFIISCSESHKNTYVIEANITELEDSWIYLARLDLSNNETIIVDSALSNNGVFSFEGRIESPYLHSIVFSPIHKFPLFIESSRILISGSINDYENLMVSGSKEDALFRSYAMDDIFDRKKGMDIMLNNPDYTYTAFVAYYQLQIHNIDIDTMELIVNQFQCPVNESVYYSYLKTLFETIKRVSVSNPAPDFSMSDQFGKEYSLGDFKGQFVLLDFWASWCPPCREANPDLLEVYREFSDKGFNIVGVSFDHDRNSWLKAISDDGLEWTNLSDLNGWNHISDLYGVKAIPQNFLLDKEGTIVAKNIKKDSLITYLNNNINSDL